MNIQQTVDAANLKWNKADAANHKSCSLNRVSRRRCPGCMSRFNISPLLVSFHHWIPQASLVRFLCRYLFSQHPRSCRLASTATFVELSFGLPRTPHQPAFPFSVLSSSPLGESTHRLRCAHMCGQPQTAQRNNGLQRVTTALRPYTKSTTFATATNAARRYTITTTIVATSAYRYMLCLPAYQVNVMHTVNNALQSIHFLHALLASLRLRTNISQACNQSILSQKIRP